MSLDKCSSCNALVPVSLMEISNVDSSYGCESNIITQELYVADSFPHPIRKYATALISSSLKCENLILGLRDFTCAWS